MLLSDKKFFDLNSLEVKQPVFVSYSDFCTIFLINDDQIHNYHMMSPDLFAAWKMLSDKLDG